MEHKGVLLERDIADELTRLKTEGSFKSYSALLRKLLKLDKKKPAPAAVIPEVKNENQETNNQPTAPTVDY